MTGKEIAEEARKVRTDFALKSTKFSGAMAAELIRRELKAEKIPTSARDVFIRGISAEIDLVVPHYNQQEPTHGVLFEPKQVAAALEIKKMGSFGQSTLDAVRNNFTKLSEKNIRGAYVTLEERASFRYKATTENIGGFECFTLSWHKVSDGPLEDTKDWERLLAFLRKQLSAGTDL